jgi:UDP-glucose 4-epimerase
MKALVTGGAGFTGSHLVDRLIAGGHQVIVYDNFSTGFAEFLSTCSSSQSFSLVRGDILDRSTLAAAMHGVDTVFHLAANADVRYGFTHPERDLQQNTIGTFNVLEAMRGAGCHRIVFSSTGALYGDTSSVPTAEDCPFPTQTSLYGASKLAGEGLIQAYSGGYGLQAFIFRLVSLLGERYTHGHIFDFYRSLLRDPTRIMVLGDGTQRKSYLYVEDCIDAILLALDRGAGRINIFNLGADDYLTVNESLCIILDELSIAPRIEYTGGARGWLGDNPFAYLDTSHIRALGWAPRLDIKTAVRRTLRWLVQNRWILERRR